MRTRSLALIALCSASTLLSPSALQAQATTPAHTATPGASVHTPTPIAIDWPAAAHVRSTKATTVVMAEIIALEKLQASMTPTDPKWVTVTHRLEAAYWQLAEAYADEAQAAGAGAKHDKAKAIYEKSRTKSAKFAQAIVDAGDTYPKLDEVLWDAARASATRRLIEDATDRASEKSDLAKARMTLLELIKKMPKSKYVPWAYLEFAELYFDEAMAGTTDFKIPIEAYTRAATDTALAPYAKLRIAYCRWNLGDPTTKASFTSAKSEATKSPTAMRAAEILADADAAIKKLP